MLRVVGLILLVRPHVRRHRCVRTIVPAWRRLHGHGLPIRHVVRIHIEVVFYYGAIAHPAQSWSEKWRRVWRSFFVRFAVVLYREGGSGGRRMLE